MLNQPENILVVRNDKLGDFILAWPALALLKKQYPDSRISVLVPAYTQELADLCPWIDHILIDENRINSYAGGIALSKIIKKGRFDTAITLFSEFRTGLALWLCKIPVRVAPASKIAQVFYNFKLVQRRSRSVKPEFEYNIDLIKYYIQCTNDTPVSLPHPPYLEFDGNEIIELKNNYLANNSIKPESKLIFVHAGSGGSANNLSLQQYADLITALARNTDCHFVLTAGPDELTIAKQLSEYIKSLPHSVYHSTKGLVHFCKFIASCDLFISGSTGPLHIAGALNKATAAFYPARRSATALRWKTLNEDRLQIAFMPEPGEAKADLLNINPVECATQIAHKLLH